MLTLKAKYLRHPFRTLRVAGRLLASRLEMKLVARRGDRKFVNDRRYRLESVTEGFASRPEDDSDDTAILERICSAYIATLEHAEAGAEAYEPTEWWARVRQTRLTPVMEALSTRDIAALRSMYRNFFRDPCSTGLVNVPYGMHAAYFGGEIKDIHRRFYISDALHRLDYWAAETGGQFSMCDLKSPRIGNPFGVVVEETLITARSDFQHYCAQRVMGLLDPNAATVAEIGGGFGGMAYYLLRDRPDTKYLDFDLPESIALTAYYLMKSFPQRVFQLFGETPLTDKSISKADIILMPLFEMKRLPAASVDVTFSSHAISDIKPSVSAPYLDTVSRITRNHFLFFGSDRSSRAFSALIARTHPDFSLHTTKASSWHSHKLIDTRETEFLYSLHPSPASEADHVSR